MAFDVKSAWAGALTSTSVRVIADTAPATAGSLLVADNEAMTGPVTIGPVSPTAEGILAFTVTGLTPNTRYWYVVSAGGLNDAYKGTFKTHPGPIGEPASYIFGAAGDAGLTGDGYDGFITNAVSNSPVFSTMTAQSRTEDWAWFSHLGDLHYRNITTNDPALFRAAYDENHNYNLGFNPSAFQGAFLRGQAITYIWDDHDFGGNNSDRTVASRPAAQQVYRECVPSYPLADAAGIYQAWQVGRVLYVATDSRSFRDPNSDPVTPAKTMLGTAQKAWLENLLLTTSAEALVWQSSSRWVGGTDTWNDFSYERAEMIQLFGDTGWRDRMLFMTADMHSVSICSGPNNPLGRFPMFMFAGMDAGAWSTGPEYDLGSIAGRRQYGTMRVQDNGHTIALTGTGYHDGTALMSHTAYVHVGNPVLALNYAARQVSEPLSPTDDDQGLRNEINAQRVDGGEYTYAKTTGPNNTGDPAESADAVGEYDEGVTLNVATDDQLPDQASWRVALGTVDEDRYPSVRIDLAANPDLADEVTGLYVGDRVTIANPPPWLAPDVIDLIAEGGTETIGHPNDWDVELNASPGSPWTVAQLPSPQTLIHGTFEQDLAGWSGNSATIARVATPVGAPFPGSWSAQITPNGSAAFGGISSTATPAGSVIPGEAYVASCWAYSPGGWSDLRACIDWYDAAGTFINTGLGTATVVAAATWTLLAQTLTAPAGASKGTARARHGGTPAAGNIWTVDEVQLQEARATGYSAGPNRPNRWDTSGAQLVNAVTSSATQLIVHTPPNGVFSRAPWVQSLGISGVYPTHFPFDVRLGGEVVRVTAITPAVLDRFTRTVANGWGTSEVGGAWTASGGAAADYDVTGGVGRHVMNTRDIFRVSYLGSVALADVDMRVNVTLPVVPTGDGIWAYVLARGNFTTGAYYFARLYFSTASTVELSLRKRLPAETLLATAAKTIPHIAGQSYRVRLQLQGTTLRAKAWPSATAEPHDWQVTATDTSITAAGAVGLRTYTSPTNTNALPVLVTFDELEVTPQVMTVQRSINTVVKAQAAGTAVSLAQPAVVAL